MKRISTFHAFPLSRSILTGLVAWWLSTVGPGNVIAQAAEGAPAIEVQPQSRTNLLGSPVTFTIQASGTEPLEYQWLFEGAAVEGAVYTSLRVNNVQPSNAGSYQVIVTNVAGSITSSVATLTVWVRPMLLAEPLSQTNRPGTSATFNVQASGTEPLSYQWVFEGEALQGATNSSLEVANVQPSNAGNYQVLVANVAGSATSSVAVLTVWVHPTILAEPQSRTNIDGTAAAFNVQASGTEPMSYQWLFEGAALEGATDSALHIANVQPINAGNYQVIVTNVAGSVTSSVATLTVWVRPMLLAEPLSQTNRPGTSATFNVQASGTDPLRYQWHFEGEPVGEATNSLLEIADVQLIDAGSYQVIVTNVAGSVTSSLATLTVWVHPTILTGPQNRTNIDGTSTVFNVQASGTEPLSYRWLFEGAPLEGATNSSLGIADVQPINAGNYQVIVTNVAGSVTSSVATLTVWVRPKLLAEPLSQTNRADSSATFSVQASGTEPLGFQWTFQGEPIPNENNPTLTVHDIQLANEGAYAVVASNVAGVTRSSDAYLMVISDPPTIETPPQSQTNLACTDATFSVDATGKGLSYQWQFNGADIAGANSSHLLLPNVGSNDVGAYTVRVLNLAGDAMSDPGTLAIEDGPKVLFEDPQLEAAVRASLGMSSTACDVTEVGLQRLTILWGGEFGITNISELSKAISLREIYLPRNSIRDLSPLANLQLLERLSFEENSVTNIEAIANLPHLTELILSRNPIWEASALTNMPNLKALVLNGTSITNLNFLTNLTSLESFSAFETGIMDVSPLSNLTGLSSLDLRWNALANVSVLSNLKNLRTLHLGATGMTNCNFAAPLTNLTLLNVAENPLNDFSPLTNLTGLTYLVLSANSPMGIQDYSPITNIHSLVNLELRGNGLTNIGFLATLTNLQYIDLAKNRLTDVSALGSLSNLTLVLDENPGFDCGSLAELTSLSKVWLNGNALTNLGFLSNMTNLTALGLDGAKAGDLSSLASLRKLEHLSLNHSPATNLGVISGLAKLQGLRLEGNTLSANITVWSSLTNLRFLSLNDNRLQDTSTLTDLTNLSSLYLWQNRLTNISTLGGLTHLSFLQVGRNLLDLGPNSPARSAVAQARHNRAEVKYAPTNQPPSISLSIPTAPRWYIPANETSALPFQIVDDLLGPEEFGLTAVSSTPVLIPNSESGLKFNTNRLNLHLLATPATNATGNLLITVTATEPGALRVSTVADVEVKFPTNVVLEPNLSNVVAQAAYAPHSPITTVDLLGITQLLGYNAGLSNLWGLHYASNLTVAYFSGNRISDLTPLNSLGMLTSLTLYGNNIEDVSALTNLTSLTYLDLSWNSITNHAGLSGLTNLEVLRLEHAGLVDLSFLTNLPQLVSLNVSDNKLTNVEPLGALTNLTSLYIQQNRLKDIALLTNLSRLQVLDARLNLLRAGSEPAFDVLRQNECAVFSDPQREPPFIDIRTNWLANAGIAATLPFTVFDSGPSDERIGVTAEISTEALAIGLERAAGPENDRFWHLWITNRSATDVTGEILISATNDVGLSSSRIVHVISADLLEVNDPLLGTNLVWTNSGDAGWFGQTFNLSEPNGAAAQSGAIGNRQTTVLETFANGPGRVSFFWKVSCETNWDYLEFAVTNYSTRISGEVDWQRKVVNVPEGQQKLTWRYYKNQSISSGLDAGWVDQVLFEAGEFRPEITSPPTDKIINLGSNATFTVAAAGPEPLRYQWYFNATNLLPGATSPSLSIPTVLDSNAGNYSVVVDNGYSTNSVASLTVNHFPIPAAPMLERYAPYGVKIRAKAFLGTDPDGDPVFLNSVEPFSAMGGSAGVTGGWVFYVPPVGYPGADTFSFTVHDNRGAVSIGTAHVTVITNSVPSLNFGIELLPDGHAQLTFDGIPGVEYAVQSATNLTNPNWQTLATLRADEFGIFTFEDTPPDNSPQRYYRAVQP